MKLTPREAEKLGLHNAGYLAQKRLARGLRLNYTEAVALIATQVISPAKSILVSFNFCFLYDHIFFMIFNHSTDFGVCS